MLERETARQDDVPEDGSSTPKLITCPGCGDDPGHWLALVSEAAANGDADMERVLPRLLRHLEMVR